MEKRGATSKKAKNPGLRRAFLFVLPIVLAGSAWEVRQLQLPIEVEIPSPGLQYEEDGGFSVKKQKTPVFQQLIARLVAAHENHPFAASISVSQVTPWPKESGLDLFFAESLEWNRVDATLYYTTDKYGWIYSHVEKSGLNVLVKAQLEHSPITLPTSILSQLRKRGWTLTEHYLP